MRLSSYRLRLSSYRYRRASCLNTLKDDREKILLLSDYSACRLMLSNFKWKRAQSCKFYTVKQTILSEYSDQVSS